MPHTLTRRIIWYVLLVVMVALALAPILWMLSTSLKPETEIISTEINWIPRQFTFTHFETILTSYPIARWLFNSLFVSTAATALVLLLDSLAGYAFARMEFRGRNALFMLILSMLFVPIQVTVVPLFILFSRMGLTNTYWALILPVGANVTGVFLMRQFFLSIPAELEDAARVDGASALRIWWSVVLPLARPALTAVAILTFLTTWNSFFWPLIATRSDDVRTLPVGIAQFLSLRAGMVQGQQSIGQSMAGAVFAALPPIIFFIVLQRYFIEGISRTGLKG
ncbi:carbohydrate ABC transporter permease [Anaerolineae bacterium CFX9]|jgi:ABC-type glycerol-3-phosphate transport system permease component|nr:carbohydrate ABC transporter permease [Oscillatoria laete-virens]MDK3158211.1 carbohydrate ABC transporter permease [Kamptonema cortianum]MDL1902895.1 carbohydrate ABC transporter permease [Anaerolineae bacterium CFX9]MDL5055447.1 carbohydrate ABC transporter permease [Oscillatoria laete-virens NRMC-F 0139]